MDVDTSVRSLLAILRQVNREIHIDAKHFKKTEVNNQIQSLKHTINIMSEEDWGK